jgi:hypothetical protein
MGPPMAREDLLPRAQPPQPTAGPTPRDVDAATATTPHVRYDMRPAVAPPLTEAARAPVTTQEQRRPEEPSAADAEGDEPDAPRRWGKYILWLVAAIIVIVIVAIIRMSAPGSTSGSLTPTTVTHSTSPVAKIPVSSNVKGAFVSASAKMSAANVTVTQALASSSGQSVAQITQEVTPYATALNTFNYTLHFVTWPAAMQVPSTDLTLRTGALATFIASISSVNTTTLGAWISQFHALAAQTETAANLVRGDIGLSNTTSYP